MSNVNLSETAPTQFQDIGGVSLAYRHFGKEGAPPVVCFQHFTGTMNNFDPIHTNRLAQDRPVILVDYRGVGRSGGEMPDSIPATAADIIAFVKAFGLKKIDLFGFSIGGMVAQQVVLDAPELVRRILLVGTGPSGGEGMQEFTREVMEIVNRPNSTEQERTLDLFFSKSPTSHAAGKAWLKRIAARKLDREPEAKPQVGEAQLVALAKWGAIPATDRYGDLKKIKQRTLVVNGKDDIMVPTINSYILQQHLPDARLILYPDSGHGSHFQFSDEFAEEAARFFAAPSIDGGADATRKERHRPRTFDEQSGADVAVLAAGCRPSLRPRIAGSPRAETIQARCARLGHKTQPSRGAAAGRSSEWLPRTDYCERGRRETRLHGRSRWQSCPPGAAGT